MQTYTWIHQPAYIHTERLLAANIHRHVHSYAHTYCVLNVARPAQEEVSKNNQTLQILAWVILGHVEPSSLYLDRRRRALRVNVALFANCAPLCERLHVFLTSMPGRKRKPRNTTGFCLILKTSTSLKPFAHFAITRFSAPRPGRGGRS